MKSYLPILALGAAMCVPSAVAEKKTTMVVAYSSETIRIPVSTQTHITFPKDLGRMIVTQEDSGDTMALVIDDIEGITFTIDEAVGVDRHELDDLVVYSLGGTVTITAPDHIDYLVCDMSGAVIASASCDGTAVIDMTSLRQGAYIIKANHKTMKFIKH